MAENKKGFILYCDQIHLFENLDEKEAGRLIKHIFRYVNDLNPKAPDKITNISFEPIKQQLKRDLKKFEAIKEKRSEAGKISAQKRQQISTNSTHVDFVKQTSTNPTDKDNVTVTDKVTVKDKDIIKKENLIETFFNDLPNSSDFEAISRIQGIPIDLLKLQIPIFRKHAELSYPSFQKFTSHFKNWVKLNPPKDPGKLKMVY